MIRSLLGAATLILLPALCSAQQAHSVADTSFKAADYLLDRDFSSQSQPEAAKHDDGKSVRRFRPDDAGIAEAVKILVAAAPDNFKGVRVESSKAADAIFGGTSYDGRVVIEGGLLAARASVEFEDGLYYYKLNLPVLRSAATETVADRVQALRRFLPPLVGSSTKAGKSSEFAGILHYDYTFGDGKPALRIEQIGSNLALYVYPKASQLSSR